MKTKKLIKKMNQACLAHDTKQERILWLKIIKKSLKHKNTSAAQ